MGWAAVAMIVLKRCGIRQ